MRNEIRFKLSGPSPAKVELAKSMIAAHIFDDKKTQRKKAKKKEKKEKPVIILQKLYQ